jgi:hypothetical protein
VPRHFDELNRTGHAKPAFVLADLNDLLTTAAGDQFESLPRPSIDDPYLANYVAAMVGLAAHLLLESPVPFRRRNIFIDSSIGARV